MLNCWRSQPLASGCSVVVAPTHPAMGCQHDLNEHAAYLAMYLALLRQDRKEIFRAAKDAQAIADLTLDPASAFAVETGGSFGLKGGVSMESSIVRWDRRRLRLPAVNEHLA